MAANPHSRHGQDGIEPVVGYLDLHRIAYTLVRPRDADELARALDAEGPVERVIVAGGDGSLHHAAPVLVERRLPLGVIPLGTANDLARTLGIPKEPVAACRVALGEARCAIDLGSVNGRLFFNVAHVGLGVEIAKSLSSESKRRWGILGYLGAGWRALRTLRPFSVRVTCDGRPRRLWTSHVGVGNGRFYGGGVPVAAQARIDDQVLHVFFITAWHPLALVRTGMALRAGRQRSSRHVRLLHGRRITLHTRCPRAISADGELVTTTPAVFEVVARALEVFVPGDSRCPPARGRDHPFA